MLFNSIKLVTGSEIANTSSIPSGATLPITPSAVGELFYLTAGTNIGLNIWDGTQWVHQVSTGMPLSSILPTTGVTTGTYTQVSVDAYGVVTAGANPTTLSGYGITDAQPLDGDLSSISALGGATGILRKTAANQWVLDNTQYQTGNQVVQVIGDATGFGTTSIPLTLSAVPGLIPGSYGSTSTVPVITLDVKGRTVGVTNTAITLSGAAITSGIIPDARIAASSITQYQSNVTIAESQITPGSLLARLASNQTISGNWSFSNPLVGVTPVNTNHLTTKAYVDAVAAGVSSQKTVRVASNGPLSLAGLQTIDGVTVANGDRILAKDQTDQTQNGIYVASTTSWVRSTDFSAYANEVQTGALVYVSEGTSAGNSSWVLTTPGTITIGTTALSFTVFSRPGDFVAGNGLTLTGHTFDVNSASSARITVNADNIDLALAGTAGNYSMVTTDAWGRVTSGNTQQAWSLISGTPTTLAGYGITDAQSINANLGGLASMSSNGIMIRTGTATYTTRTLGVSGAGISLTNGDGIYNNPTITSNATSSSTAGTLVVRDGSNNFAAGTITASLNGNASTATALQNGRILTITGDGAGASPAFDGTTTVNIPLTLTTVNNNVGQFGSSTLIPVITVDGKGRITAVGGAIPSIPFAATSSTLTTGRYISNSGDATGTSTAAFDGSSNVNIPLTLATVNAAPVASAFQKITVNGKGLVTSTTSVIQSDILASLGYTPVNKAGDASITGALTSSNASALGTPVLPWSNIYVNAVTSAGAVAGGAFTGTSFNSITGLSGTNPLMDGNVSIGSATSVARADHVHPTDTSRGAIASPLSQFASTTSAQLHGVISDPTGSGALVFSTSPTLVSPNLGTPSVLVATNATGTAAGLTAGAVSSITSAQVTSALGYTPYNSSNPNSFGTVTSVTATAPVASTGGNTPVISMAAASASTNGYMSTAYASKLDGIANGATANAGTVTSVSGSGTVSGLTLSGTVSTSGVLTLGGSLSLSSGQITTGLGYTPYNSSNPSGYITSSGSISGNAATATTAATANTVAWGNVSGKPTNLSSFTNDLGNYGGWITSSGSISGNAATATNAGYASTAGSATTAGSASTAGSATSASYAVYLTGAPAHTNGSDGWFRSAGAAGWYNETYATGVYSAGTGLVQTYNSASFQVNGTMYATGDVQAFYSDMRLKIKTGDIENALDKVSQLSGFYYTINDIAKGFGFSNDGIQIGVSAQEVQAVVPEAVKSAPFDIIREGDDAGKSKSGEDYLTVQYERLVPLLIEAIKELKLEVNGLRSEIADLKITK